jgi:hypothetical protein
MTSGYNIRRKRARQRMEATPIRNSADATLTAGRVLTEPSPKQRARRTNDPFSGLSKNTAIGRRVADLLRSFLRAMGDPDDVVLQANALRAAELTVAAEAARGRLLAGGGDADQVVRLEGTAARAARALGLDRKREPAGETIADIMREADDG